MAGNQGLHSAENGKLGGRPKLFASKLREALIRKAEENADALADVLYDKAQTGDVPAIKEMMDRALGKALMQADFTTNGESLNERITKLDDGQLEQLIASVHTGRLEAPHTGAEGGTGGTAVGETEKAEGESA